jgi:hypothetical protein
MYTREAVLREMDADDRIVTVGAVRFVNVPNLDLGQKVYEWDGRTRDAEGRRVYVCADVQRTGDETL